MEWFLIVLIISLGDFIVEERLGPYISLKYCETAAYNFEKYARREPEDAVEAYCILEEK